MRPVLPTLSARPADPPPPVPAGFRIVLDRGTREVAPGVWSGGSPARVVRLSDTGRTVWRRLCAGQVDSRAAGVLARHLTDAGLAHPCPPPVAPGSADVTVVIPVRDRADRLDRCLAALGGTYPVVVVDDASRDPAAIAAVAAAHGAVLVRRVVNGGPGAARSTGLEHVATELVAFVDSDCVPCPDARDAEALGWIDRLAGHLADPLVAAVAPRITALGGGVGSLDLGDRPARVAPRTRVSYVPTAALLARRSAVAGFDPDLRVGEDVDLVWRLHAAGWRIRYDPTVRVGHEEPATWRARLARRMSYGTSAAPLALRHPENVPAMVVDGWSAATVAALLARRPLAAAAAFTASVLAAKRTLGARGLPTAGVVRVKAADVAKTFAGAGSYATRYALPVLAGLALRGGPRGRAAVAALLAAPPLLAWATGQPRPLRSTAAAIADDIAYGAGVWAGCLRHRTLTPLRPVLGARPGKRGITVHERERADPQRPGALRARRGQA